MRIQGERRECRLMDEMKNDARGVRSEATDDAAAIDDDDGFFRVKHFSLNNSRTDAPLAPFLSVSESTAATNAKLSHSAPALNSNRRLVLSSYGMYGSQDSQGTEQHG